MEKTKRLSFINIVTIQFNYTYFYSRIILFVLRLRKCVLSISYACKTETTHAGLTSSKV